MMDKSGPKRNDACIRDIAAGDGNAESELGTQVVAPDFGRPSGTPIVNKGSIMQEIDQSLGFDEPPALEYILVQPFSLFRLPIPGLNVGFGWNQYGHSLVRYTLPDGRSIVRTRIARPNGPGV